MAARFSVVRVRSSIVRQLQRHPQIRAISNRSSSMSSLILPQNAISSVSQYTPPFSLSTLTIPTAACVYSSASLGFTRTYSSDSELPSNVVLVQSDDQLKDSLRKAEDEFSQAIFYFTAVWCGPCQFLWPDMKKLSEHLPDVKFYKIDIDEVGAGPTISKLSIFSVENRLRWFGHLRRRPQEARVGVWDQRDLKRARGRRHMTWLEGVRKDMKQLDLNEEGVFNRREWKRSIASLDCTE